MSVHEPCPECGAADMVVHIQRVSEGRFRCSTSVACDACACRSEADGDELGPDAEMVRGTLPEAARIRDLVQALGGRVDLERSG